MSIFLRKRVYLDHAAATPAIREARKAYARASKISANPSSLHKEGVTAKAVLERARKSIAELLGVRATGIVFTSGATESNNLAIIGAVEERLASGVKPEDLHVLYHEGAHSSLVECVRALSVRGVLTEPLSTKNGVPDMDSIRAQIRKETVLVAMESVSGETGTVFNTRDVRRILDAYEREHGGHILLHVDASQAPRVRSVSLVKHGADTLSLDAQKCGGVRGIGILAITNRVKIHTLLYGGPQEYGLRPGTENPALAYAFSVALLHAEANRTHFNAHSKRLRALCTEEFSNIPDMHVLESSEQAPHILNVSFKGRDTDYLLFLLDAKGFAVSTKSACESDQEGSRMVLHMTGDSALAASTLRISFGPETRAGDVRRFAKAVTESVRFLDENVVQ